MNLTDVVRDSSLSEKEKLRKIKEIVEQSADIHADIDLALGWAANKGYLKIVKYLVEQGADIHADDDSALSWAADKGHLEIVKYLVEKGADIHADDDWAFRLAAENGYLEIVKYLVEQGADIHTGDDFALRLAAENGYLEVVRYLVENGANIHANNDSALSWAAKNGHLEIVKCLVEQGANIRADDDLALRSAAKNGHLEIVKCLVEKGANIHADDDFALGWAAKNGHLEIVKCLVENGANIHADDDLAFRWAAYYGHIEIVKYLVENGANIHADDDLALKWAAGKGHLEIVKYLVEKGADIHIHDDLAIRRAAENGHLNIIKYLIEQGADIHAYNDSALRWAADKGHLEVVKYLKKVTQNEILARKNNSSFSYFKNKIEHLLFSLKKQASSIPKNILDAAVEIEKILPKFLAFAKKENNIKEVMDKCQVMNMYGDLINPFNLKSEDFRPELITKSLSREFRFWNQTDLTVAEHCLNMVKVIEKIYPNDNGILKKWAMIHEVYEAYTGDLATPFKRCLPEYEIAEKKALATFAKINNLPVEMPKEINFIDKKMMIKEAYHLMPNPNFWLKKGEEIGNKLFGISLEPFDNEILFIDKNNLLSTQEAEIAFAKKWAELGLFVTEELQNIIKQQDNIAEENQIVIPKIEEGIKNSKKIKL